MDKLRCKQQVHDGGRSVSFHQCLRGIWKDGYCHQHHLATVAARDEATKQRQDRYWQLKELVWDIREAESRLAKRAVRLRLQGHVLPGNLAAACARLDRLQKRYARLRKAEGQ